MNNKGFNAKTGKIEDLVEAGVIDPNKIVKNAVTNAISMASVVLTTRVIVTLPPEIAPQPQMPIL